MEKNQGIQEYLSKLSAIPEIILSIESHKKTEVTVDTSPAYQEAGRGLS